MAQHIVALIETRIGPIETPQHREVLVIQYALAGGGICFARDINKRSKPIPQEHG